MIVHARDDRLVIDAPAKVNLHLEVLGKRADGYHELETLFVAVSLFDTLVFRSEPAGTTVTCNLPALSRGSDNLVTRAVELVRSESGRTEGIGIELTKRIPLAAGLGGGSSDAAATLVGLNRWWGLGWPLERLDRLAAQLGSDVNFFLRPPAAIGHGRGEKITPCRLGARLDLVLICPAAGLSTAEVFRRLRPPLQPRPVGPIVAALEGGNVPEVARLLFNRLEEPAVGLLPELAELKRQAAGWECLGHLMSGSGSTYFALCSSDEQARNLADALVGRVPGDVLVVHSCH